MGGFYLIGGPGLSYCIELKELKAFFYFLKGFGVFFSTQ